MVNVAGTEVPFNVSFAGLSTTITFVLLIVFLIIVGGIAAFFIMRWRIYNRKVIDFENIGNTGYQVVFRDRARLIKIGDGGEEVLYLMKRKQYRTAYGKKMGKNTYWFAKGQDGYYYNTVLGDFDAKRGMLDIEPIDRDMRYMHVAIRKNIQDRYKSKNMITATAIVVGGIVLCVLILMIGMWYNMSKINQNIETSNKGMETAKEVTEKTAQIISSLDNICSGGSGISRVAG